MTHERKEASCAFTSGELARLSPYEVLLIVENYLHSEGRRPKRIIVRFGPMPRVCEN